MPRSIRARTLLGLGFLLTADLALAQGVSPTGGTISVTDGVTTIAPAKTLDFTSGATVTDGGGGTANVAVTGGSGCPAGIEAWDGTAAKTIAATTNLLYTTGSTPIASARALTLPTVASYTLGCPLTVVDLAAIFNATNVVTPTRQSSDTIDGATTGTTLGAARQSVTYVATTAGKWATTAPPTLASDAAVSNQFVTAVPDTGIITRAQPSASNLSNGVTGSGAVVLAAGGALTGVTGLAIRDSSAAFDVTIAGTSSTALSAGRTLTLDMKNVAHTLAFGGTANTITFPNTASYTLVGSGDTGTVTNTMLAGSIDLTTKVTGTLPYGNGGTGATAFTNHGVVVAGASALSTVAPGTSGNVLTSNGTDWTSAAAAGGGSGGGLFQYSDNGLTLTAGTRYVPVGGSGTPSTTEADYSTKAPSALTVNNLQVNLSADPGAGQTLVVTLRKNNVDQALTCTVTGPLTPPAAVCQDLTHSISVAQNDLIDWKIVTTGTFVATPSVTIMANNGTTNAGLTTALSCDAWITGASTFATSSSGNCGTVSGGTWTSPSWITANTVMTLEVIGAGGGGGGTNVTGDDGVGGGSGAVCVQSQLNLIAASTGYSFAVGAAGAAGANTGGTGGTGGTSSLTVGGTTYTATGGVGGGGNVGSTGATVPVSGGTASNCNVANIKGQAGNLTYAYGYTVGGNTRYGTGGYLLSNGSNAAGVAGSGFGAGGSGAITESGGTAEVGGAGAPGVIHIGLTGI